MAKYATSSNVVRLHLNKEDNISTIDVLRALNQHQDSIIGAQTSYKGQAIDVVCTSDTVAAEIATQGIDHEDVPVRDHTEDTPLTLQRNRSIQL
ncbi:hypothetical protein QZH41_003003 [Actinostola sp. cb2023]|nr:hypothetical protein QZH41_003003 [Actinostola sp. cb2023]